MREGAGDVTDGVASLEELEGLSAPPSITSAFKNAMRNLAAGVSVVTVGTDDEASGFTATSVVSLSVDTPSVLVSIDSSSASWPILHRSCRFTVNLLSASHHEIAETFAGRRGLRGNQRYVDPRWQRSAGQVPYLLDALAVIECDLEEAIPRYSHVILIGNVVKVAFGGARTPLVYWQGGYNQVRERSREL